MTISIPKLALVVLVGPSGAGKSTFARRHFLPTEILSSDACRGMVSDDENNQAATGEAFALLHYVAAQRLALGRLTVVDATNVQPEARAPLVALARKYHCLPVAIVLDLPEEVCQGRNQSRADRTFGPHVIRNQRSQLRRSLRVLSREGFRNVFVLDSVEAVEAATIERVPMWNDRTHEDGPFDIIGDVHGCAAELEQLLATLGYVKTVVADAEPGWSNVGYVHPAGRKALFVGDLVDRGPRVLDTLRIVRNMVALGSALCVPGNHDMKLLRALNGRDVKITHGLAQSLGRSRRYRRTYGPRSRSRSPRSSTGLSAITCLIAASSLWPTPASSRRCRAAGRAVSASFACTANRPARPTSSACPCGSTGRPSIAARLWSFTATRRSWSRAGSTTPSTSTLAASSAASSQPCVTPNASLSPSRRPEAQTAKLTDQQFLDDLLDAEDVLGKRIVSTRLRGNVTIREAHATAALEVMSRFAADPKWLIYLPPTMSPCETSREPGLLEHPAEAFAYYRTQGATRVICEEKHIGSLAVVIVCKDEAAARERFGVLDGESGIVLTRTGRRFFNDATLEREFLERVRTAIMAADLWAMLNTTWVCLDCELMPWSAKAQELLKQQYAAVGSAGRAALPRAAASLAAAANRLTGEERAKLDAVVQRVDKREAGIQKFVAAYRQYCWPVHSLADLKLAPFHLLASEGKFHVNESHVWHMDTIAAVCRADPEFLLATPYRLVDLADPASVAEGIAWWTALTARGGEGMVVKPFDLVHQGSRGLSQPAVKCRGPEYLRIIYGPDYDADVNLTRLRHRGLGHKRALALGEFALGIEGLERFVRREPLRRVHECVCGVLALESEPVDPRL